MEQTSHLNARIPQELHQRLKQRAKETGSQMTVLIILALQEFLGQGEGHYLPPFKGTIREIPPKERVRSPGTLGTFSDELWP